MSDPLATLKTTHPRLLLSPGEMDRVRRDIAAYPEAAQLRAYLLEHAEGMLPQPPVTRKLGGRPGYMAMLGECRTALDRVYTLAFAYLLEGGRRFADRAIAEMLAAAAFEDWNPSHWLDVAEMMHALAIGYDWLYDLLSVDQRQAIRTAILEKGLRAAERAYAENTWWATNAYNWNNVCNGAVIIGALAIGDEEPEIARRLIERAVANLPLALASYAPDGAWAEGPGYWGFAMRYTAAACGAMRTALGHDFGLTDLPGVAEAGLFRVQGEGPTGLFFNFADAAEWAPHDPSLFWLARRYGQPLLAYEARQGIAKIPRGGTFGLAARSLLWFDARGDAGGLAGVPTEAFYAKTSVGFMRTSWTDPAAVYVGFKGGDNQANHGHCDLGTFVLDAGGVRWAIDLGPGEYTAPGYWEGQRGGRRWEYYRCGTSGHNTLLIDGRGQDPLARATLTRTGPREAVVDLTAAYPGVELARRTVRLVGTRVVVEDQVRGARQVEWRMHTQAEASVQCPVSNPQNRQGGRVLLRQASKVLEMTVEGGRVALEEVQGEEGVRRVVVRAEAGQIRVELGLQS